VNVARHRFLKRDEEVALARRYQAGDSKAGEEIIRCNQLFAARRAWKWSALGVPMEDLFQEANLGMLRALQSFDPERGLRFTTYAAGWMDSFIGKRIKSDSTLVRRATTEAKHRSFYRDLPGHRASECSLDAQSHALAASEGPSAEEQLLEHSRREEIRAAVRLIPDRERFIIEQRLLSESPMQLGELGAHFGFSRQYAKQLEERALAKLRRHLSDLEAA
jgi:RNA polymerase sigma-32 factor